jgi:serine/threonine protein kinase
LSKESFKEIIESTNYLHKQNRSIFHRDLKPKNILITNGMNGKFVKIADFGLSVVHKF